MIEKILDHYLLLVQANIFPSNMYISKKDYAALCEELEKRSKIDRLYNMYIVIVRKGPIRFE